MWDLTLHVFIYRIPPPPSIRFVHVLPRPQVRVRDRVGVVRVRVRDGAGGGAGWLFPRDLWPPMPQTPTFDRSALYQSYSIVSMFVE